MMFLARPSVLVRSWVTPWTCARPLATRLPPKRDPERPLRPATSWILFLQEFRAQNGGLKGTEVMSAASQKWQSMAADMKAKYEEPAKEARSKYAEAMKSYVESSKKDAWKRDPERPTRPLSPYMRFMQEYRKLATGSMVEVTQAGAAEWRAKSDAEKQHWASNYEAEKAEYAEAMKKYKESGKEAAYKEKVGILAQEEKLKAKKEKEAKKAKKAKVSEKAKAKAAPKVPAKIAKAETEVKKAKEALKQAKAAAKAKAKAKGKA
ncbi:unnamed protein product [Effrenium voratum]|uniref:HMG box domain-containing protein n=1 Tax=Effrenium voratum TaxID=2562239 RepID=A0AA36MXK5_9DINO|nr:unnamed protein product [Effrenium voratum]